jgi:hypothetical protein
MSVPNIALWSAQRKVCPAAEGVFGVFNLGEVAAKTNEVSIRCKYPSRPSFFFNKWSGSSHGMTYLLYKAITGAGSIGITGAASIGNSKPFPQAPPLP